jgi:hypothetical protein
VRPTVAGNLVVQWTLVHTIRRSLLLLAAMAFLLGGMLTAAGALGSFGSTTSAQGNVAQAAPPKPSVRICSVTERCAPEAPLNSPVPMPQILALGFVAATMVILANRFRRTKPAEEILAPLSALSAIFRPPIAS